MPWCETCDRFYNPNSLQADGTCPACGRDVGGSLVATATAADGAPATPATPWHFKLLLLATVAYLGWRLVEGIVWVADHL